MKEQIEEMVKSFIDGKDVPSGADCRLCLFDRDVLYIKVAEALYNAGYRKQKEGEWISVEDRLPEYTLTRDIFGRPQDYVSDSVLVCVESSECDGVHRYVSTDFMIGRKPEEVHWLMSCGYGGTAVYHQKITHWMPLPEPPKKGGE